jgi:hypothetical protein
MPAKRKPAARVRVAKVYPFHRSLYLVEFTTPNGTLSTAHVAETNEVTALASLRMVRIVEQVKKVTFLGYVLVPANPTLSQS